MPRKLGVYVCSGCGIGDAVDTEQLVKIARRELKAPVCQVHPFLCGPEGRELISKDLAIGTVDTVVVAACSPRAKTDAFAYGAKVVLERVNLREHVAWCHNSKDEDTQMLAEDYLRMGVAKAQKAEPTEPLAEAVSKKLLVVGGGVSGVTAALEAAAAGYEVVLVEKDSQLGGFIARLKSRFPGAPPYSAAGPGWLGPPVPRGRLQPENPGPHLGAHRQDRGSTGYVRRFHRARGRGLDGACRRDRSGHGLEAVRRYPSRASRLRPAERDHERRTGAHGGTRDDQAAFRRPAGRERPVRAVRRLARPRPPALLLGRLLHGDAQARRLCSRSESAGEGLRRLQGHPDAGAVRAFLPRRPGPSLELSDQGRGGFCRGACPPTAWP